MTDLEQLLSNLLDGDHVVLGLCRLPTLPADLNDLLEGKGQEASLVEG